VIRSGVLMSIRVVRLGTRKGRSEGTRFGTIRRPPRGVPKKKYAAESWFDVWLPNLAPSADLMRSTKRAGGVEDSRRWRRFVERYRSEMGRPENSRLLDAFAALSHRTNFSVGCYCEDERRCHRSILRGILKKHGARIASR
jgi:uncharacterized protein YeaO (DUF488 family)